MTHGELNLQIKMFDQYLGFPYTLDKDNGFAVL